MNGLTLGGELGGWGSAEFLGDCGFWASKAAAYVDRGAAL